MMSSVADLTTSRNNRQTDDMSRQENDFSRYSDEGGCRLLGQNQLSDMLGVPVGTLEQWRTRGGGPPFLRIGRYVKYDLSDIREWLVSRRNLPRGAS
jgi:Helix-turn-helix domain